MKGWHYFFVGVICAFVGAFYLINRSGLNHAGVSSRTQKPPLEGSAGPGMMPSSSPEPGAGPVLGMCYLTMPVEVPNKYGEITYPQGTMLRALGRQGGLLIVETASNQFTIAPGMVTENPGMPAATSGLPGEAVQR